MKMLAFGRAACLAAALAVTPLLPGCAIWQDIVGPTEDLNKGAVVLEQGVAAAADVGVVLVATGVLKKDSGTVAGYAEGLAHAAGYADQVNTDIQAGTVSAAQELLNLGNAALHDIRGAAPAPTPEQAKALRAAAPKSAMPKNASASAIIDKVITLLPVILTGAEPILDLAKQFLANMHQPGAAVTPADVQAGNDTMHAALDRFVAAVR